MGLTRRDFHFVGESACGQPPGQSSVTTSATPSERSSETGFEGEQLCPLMSMPREWLWMETSSPPEGDVEATMNRQQCLPCFLETESISTTPCQRRRLQSTFSPISNTASLLGLSRYPWKERSRREIYDIIPHAALLSTIHNRI